MTLIITACAALVATIARFASPAAERLRLGMLALMYWGASIMWCVDGFACMAEGEPFVELSDSAAMADDALLGACVVALGLLAWGVTVFVKKGKASPVTA